MCLICSLLENSFPYPKALVRTFMEVNPDIEHMEELARKIYISGGFRTLKELNDYTDEVTAELYELERQK